MGHFIHILKHRKVTMRRWTIIGLLMI